MASQCGNRIEAEKIFNYIKQLFPEVICVLDACQSIGQIEVDVKKINCDVISNIIVFKKFSPNVLSRTLIVISKYTLLVK